MQTLSQFDTDGQGSHAAIDPLDDLERRALAGEEVYEDAINLGVTATEDEEAVLWKHARIASIVGRRYGEHFIAEYAKAVKKKKRTIYDRAQVYRFYPDDARRALLDGGALVYSHLRTAMRLALNQSEDAAEQLDIALEFLDDVILYDWTCDQADVEAAKQTGNGDVLVKVVEFVATARGDKFGAHILIDDEHGLKAGQCYTVRVFEKAAKS